MMTEPYNTNIQQQQHLKRKKYTKGNIILLEFLSPPFIFFEHVLHILTATNTVASSVANTSQLR